MKVKDEDSEVPEVQQVLVAEDQVLATGVQQVVAAQDQQPDNVGDAEEQFLEILEQFLIAEGGSSIDDDHEAVDKGTESANPEKPHTSSSDFCGQKDLKTRPAVTQPSGKCDPESELPCLCPRRTFVDLPEEMPMASNRKAL